MKPNETNFAEKMLSLITDEKVKRLFLGGYSSLFEYGSISELSRCTGVSRTTITRGAKEFAELDLDFDEEEKSEAKRTRKEGGGRKRLTAKYPQLIDVFYSMMEKNPLDYPEHPLCWTTKSVHSLQSEFLSKSIRISLPKMAELFSELDVDTHRYIEKSIGPEKLSSFNSQYDFVSTASRIFMGCDFPVLYIDINTFDPGKYEPVSQIVDVIDLWGKEKRRIRRNYVFRYHMPSVMVVLGSRDFSLVRRSLCRPVAEKASELLGKDVLVSILPDGISKWQSRREMFRLYGGGLVLYEVNKPNSRRSLNSKQREVLFNRLMEKSAQTDFNFFFRRKAGR